MKKILLSAGMIVFMGALLAGATGAFFSDSETSTGNTFTAGDIDLKIDNTSYVTNNEGELVASPNNTWTLDDLDEQLFFSFEDVKPGDIGEDTISIHPGTNDAYACMAADITATPDNGINEPEGEAGDITDGDGGELQNYLNFSFWEDDGDNVYEEGEAVITELTGPASTIFDGSWLPIADSANGPALPGGSTTYVGKAWCFGTLTPAAAAQDGNGSSTPLTRGTTGFTCDGSGDNNIAQTDGIVVDVSFYAVQARNNSQFLCSTLPPFGGGEEPPVGPTVGALLSSYAQPEVCDAYVDDFEAPGDNQFTTIQAAIDAAGTVDGETVCVAAGTYDEDVTVSKGITLAGAGSATTNINGQTAGEAGAVVITANNATVRGFNVTEATGGVAAIRISGARSGITIDSNTMNAVTGGNAFLTDGGQSNHTISNNVINGVAGQPIAYVNGLASVNVASANVDFTGNTFGGAGTLALGQEADGSSITLNKFSAVTGYTDVEDWGTGNNVNQNNFNDAVDADVLHPENGNTGPNGILNAQNNWWGDANPADGDAGTDVDSTSPAAVAFPQN